jgi:hypothetical protein
MKARGIISSAPMVRARGWDVLNGRRRPWSSNPWVWAISFKRVRP